MQLNHIKTSQTSSAHVWAKECKRGQKDAQATISKYTKRKQKAPWIDHETDFGAAIKAATADASEGYRTGFFYAMAEHLLGGAA